MATYILGERHRLYAINTGVDILNIEETDTIIKDADSYTEEIYPSIRSATDIPIIRETDIMNYKGNMHSSE